MHQRKESGRAKVMIRQYIDGEINILTSCDYFTAALVITE